MKLPTTPRDTACLYAERFNWHVFPCISHGHNRKHPCINRQHERASTDLTQIEAWWTRWPDALIGVSAGHKSGVVCLDVDVKKPQQNGFDTLERLGVLPLPDTPMVHTPSGGLHVLFAQGEERIRTTGGMLGRSKGEDGKWQSSGLDVRSDNNSFTAAAPGSGYAWDPLLHLETVPLVPAPSWLNPAEPVFVRPTKPVRPCDGLSPYGDAAIAQACQAIRQAPDGQQRETLVRESFSIGTLAAAGALPPTFAKAALLDAGYGMQSFDSHDPWTPKELARVVSGAFAAGLARPRATVGRRAAR
jgi:putative DNA primase/helicase